MFRIVLCIILFAIGMPLAAEPARLRVLSEPSGADVYVDGVLAGKAPLEIDASVLRHVRVKKDGYQEAVMPVRADSPSEVLFLLKKAVTPESSPLQPGPIARPQARSPGSVGAMLRSMVLPGWGQISKGDPSGYWFGVGSMVTAGAYFYYGSESRRYLDRLIRNFQLEDIRTIGYGVTGASSFPTQSALFNAYTQAGLAGYALHGNRDVADTLARTCTSGNVYYSLFTNYKKECRGYSRSARLQRQAGYAFLGIYTWNVLDALLSNPRIPVAAAPIFGEDRGLLVAARIRF